MDIIPAIDILNGKVVRLFQGEYEQSTSYPDSPEKTAKFFSQKGFSRIHVIDLLGAKTGKPHIYEEIASIAATGLDVQVGGGIRSLSTIRHYLDLGVKRVILSTQALLDHEFVTKAIQESSGKSIIISLDVREGRLAINGWLEEHPTPIEEVLARLESQGITQFIITDISRDGTLSGTNCSLYASIKKQFPAIDLYAAGGITSERDIEKLHSVGVCGVIIGKAIYENTMCI